MLCRRDACRGQIGKSMGRGWAFKVYTNSFTQILLHNLSVTLHLAKPWACWSKYAPRRMWMVHALNVVSKFRGIPWKFSSPSVGIARMCTVEYNGCPCANSCFGMHCRLEWSHKETALSKKNRENYHRGKKCRQKDQQTNRHIIFDLLIHAITILLPKYGSKVGV